ncbi:MAG: FtsX-like permease family protein [Candidatus Latescibacteria bacterium]|nr:FtsX-like permease family protein [Candidatus Latescibacterota bacterium]
MLKNVIVTGVRNLARHKAYALLNIVGLTIGIAGCLLVLLFVRLEISRGASYPKADRIYRVISWTLNNDNERRYNRGADGRIGPALLATSPEVEEVVRSHMHWPVRVRYGDVISGSHAVSVVDPSFLETFAVELISGDRHTALSTPNGVVIAERAARTIFGDQDPMGQTLTVDHQELRGEYTVTGVAKDPAKTVYALNFNLLTSHRTQNERVTTAWNDVLMGKAFRPVQTFVLLREGVDVERLSARLGALNTHVNGREWAGKSGYALQPLQRIHLYGREDYPGIAAFGSIQTVYVLSGIALFVLLIAVVNFVNLTTVRFAQRTREVGIRKAVGAGRRQLVSQFLSESMLLTFGASLLAVLTARFALPAFNSYVARRNLTLDGDLSLWLTYGVLTLVVGVLAGLYPALVMTRLRPTYALFGGKTRGGIPWLRKILVLFQFALSVALITSTLVLRDQVHYLLSKDTGLDRSHVLWVPIISSSPELKSRSEEVKRAFGQNPHVLGTSLTSILPVYERSVKVIPEGCAEAWTMLDVTADEDFIDLMGVELIAGRNFSRDRPSDSSEAFLLNETAVRQLGWEVGAADPQKEALGKWFHWPDLDRQGHIVGIVKDFHIGTLKERTKPAFLAINRGREFNLLVKIRPERVSETMDFLDETWRSFSPDKPFRYRFLDDAVEYLHREEIRISNVATGFGVLAIVIACLGLFSMASFTAEQRTKEMTIRKVVGASVGSLFALLTRGFLQPVLLACLMGWPIAYVLMNRWLSDYAHRIDLDIGPFLMGGVGVMTAALVTVGYRTLKAARANPVDALRHD